MIRPRIASGGHRPARFDQATVLIVGHGEPMEDAVREALGRYGFTVEKADPSGARDAVRAAAPDLVLLLGDAASDGGAPVLQVLSGTMDTSVVPTALLLDESRLDVRLDAFRHGAAAVIPRSHSADAIAARVAELVRDIPHRMGEVSGEIGESTLEELVGALASHVRSGVLSVKNSGGEVRLVLGQGRRVAKLVDEFVTRLKPLVVTAEPLRYEFDEHPAGALRVLGADDGESEGSLEQLKGLRLLIADSDAGRADALAQSLRAHDAQVFVTDIVGKRVEMLRHLDPQVLIVGERDLSGAGYGLTQAMRHDSRLRWTSLLVVNWHEIWPDATKPPPLRRLATALAAMVDPDHSLRERASRGEAFDTRLEVCGPARLLRSMVEAGRMLEISVTNPRAVVRVSIGNELIIGATAELREPQRSSEGPEALAVLFALSSGRVHVETRERPLVTNLMATPDVALNLAASERPPLAPSVPPLRMTAEVGEGVERRPRWSDGASLRRATQDEEPTVVSEALRAPKAPSVSEPEANSNSPFSVSSATPKQTELPKPVKPRRNYVGYAVGAVALFAAAAIASAWLLPPKRHAERPPLSLPAATPAYAPARAEAERAAAVAGGTEAPAAKAESVAAPPVASSAPAPAEQKPPAAAESASATAEQAATPPPQKPRLTVAQYMRMRAAIKRGEQVLGDGKRDESRAAFEEALSIDPTSVPARLGLAAVALEEKDTERAEHELDEALKIRPNCSECYYLLGRAYLITGDKQRAAVAWRRAVDIDPENSRARHLLGLPALKKDRSRPTGI